MTGPAMKLLLEGSSMHARQLRNLGHAGGGEPGGNESRTDHDQPAGRKTEQLEELVVHIIATQLVVVAGLPCLVGSDKHIIVSLAGCAAPPTSGWWGRWRSKATNECISRVSSSFSSSTACRCCSSSCNRSRRSAARLLLEQQKTERCAPTCRCTSHQAPCMMMPGSPSYTSRDRRRPHGALPHRPPQPLHSHRTHRPHRPAHRPRPPGSPPRHRAPLLPTRASTFRPSLFRRGRRRLQPYPRVRRPEGNEHPEKGVEPEAATGGGGGGLEEGGEGGHVAADTRRTDTERTHSE